MGLATRTIFVPGRHGRRRVRYGGGTLSDRPETPCQNRLHCDVGVGNQLGCWFALAAAGINPARTWAHDVAKLRSFYLMDDVRCVGGVRRYPCIRRVRDAGH